MSLLFLLLLFLFQYSHPNALVSARCTTVTATKTFQKCMSLPSQQASIAWTYHPKNITLEMVFFGSFISPSGWVGWGINPNSAEMTGTRALIAFPDPKSGQLVLLPYILDPNVKLQKNPLLSRPLDIHLISSSAILYGGRLATIHDGASIQIYATFKLLSNKTKIHHVWNRGLYVQGYSPTIHPTTVNDLSSVATVDVLSGIEATRHDKYKSLKVAHGIINAISWGILLPLGAVIARYLRHIKALGPAWFYAHAGVQLSAFLLGTAGFSIGIRLGELSPGRVYSLHRNLGLAAFCLGSLQTLALLFRPKTTNKFRKYWKSYHHFVGYACVVPPNVPIMWFPLYLSCLLSLSKLSGEIHVIVGPMFAGKTTALLRRINSEINSGRNVAMIKSGVDTRYAVDSVVTHDGTKFPCYPLMNLLSFKEKFGIEAYNKVDVIGIDEAQFFDDLYDFCCEAADCDGKTVIVAGLDGDFLRRRFGSVLDIIPLADTITKLTARCELCGKRAFFTLRKTEETKTELIGGADVYMPVCRQHYVNGQAVIESARSIIKPCTKVQRNSSALVEEVAVL